MENNEMVETKKTSLGKLIRRMNPLSLILTFVVHHLRGVIAFVAMVIGGYLVWSGFNTGFRLDNMEGSLKKIGDSDLLRYYEQAKNAKERQSLSIAFKAYEKQYGKGAWVQKFKQENRGEDIAYRDIAEVAVGLSTAKERDEFIASHAAIYETCVKNGMIDLALRYGKTLVELRDKGGKSWRVASCNPFAICVYEAVKHNSDLWNWYLDNSKWCDSFLMTIEPELQDGTVQEGEGLLEAVEAVRDHALLLKQFAEEIGKLTDDELKLMADGENIEECKESLFASCLMFVGLYHNVLMPMLQHSSQISMLEAMAVLANNYTAFGLDEDALDSPNKCRDAAMGFLKVHDERNIIWEFAQDERGIGCIRLCEKVGNDEWCEQVIGMFGEVEVVPFLNKYYGESPELLRVATEVLYRCQETGWAVLNEYKANSQVKNLLLNPKIGCRLIPYYLKNGYGGFSTLTGDERWIDEEFDPNGKLKRKDVSWYEMSPIGGDVATVVKKWAQNRPVTAGELGWAALDIADTAAMAFSFGASKAATTGVKTAVKVTVKRIAQRIARDISKKTMRQIAKSTTLRAAKSTVKGTVKTTVKGTAKAAAKEVSKGAGRKISFLKKVNKWFRKAPGVAFKGKNSTYIAKKPTALKAAWNATCSDVKQWEKVYKGCKTLMWCRYLGHTVPDKSPDFIYATLEKSGEFVGETLNALVEGAGDGLKAAVREALGLPDSPNVDRIIRWMLGGVLFVFGFLMFAKVGRRRKQMK